MNFGTHLQDRRLKSVYELLVYGQTRINAIRRRLIQLEQHAKTTGQPRPRELDELTEQYGAVLRDIREEVIERARTLDWSAVT